MNFRGNTHPHLAANDVKVPFHLEPVGDWPNARLEILARYRRTDLKSHKKATCVLLRNVNEESKNLAMYQRYKCFGTENKPRSWIVVIL
jgi:hypothetical protein